MSSTNAVPKRVIKVSLEDNIVRLSIELPSGLFAKDSLVAIQTAVAQAFELSDEQAAALVLTYPDDEGDLCTLTENTIDDLLALTPNGTIRLHAALSAQTSASAQNENMDVDEAFSQLEACQGTAEAGAPNQGPEASAANQGAVPPTEESNTHANFIANMAAQFLPFWLPHVAADLQREEKRSELSRLGAEKREQLLPLCERLRERLDHPEEVQMLKPRLDSYIDGSDLGHFGDFCADLFQAFTTFDSKEIVQATMQDFIPVITDMHVPSFNSGEHMQGQQNYSVPSTGTAEYPGMPLGLDGLLGNLLTGKGIGKGTGVQPTGLAAGHPDMPLDLGAMLGNIFAGKGVGKGTGSQPTDPPNGAGASPGMPVDVGAMLGSLFAGKGLGKGAGSQRDGTSAVPDFGAMLGSLFAGKGVGKGAGSQCTGSATGTSASPGMPVDVTAVLGHLFAGKGVGKGTDTATAAASAATAAAAAAAATATTPTATAATSATTFDISGEGQSAVAEPATSMPSSEEAVQVRDLTEMGLVSDPQLALDLLRMHDGNMSAVVDVLTS